MLYENDPRERQINLESGVTWENDNRVEEMYHWGAMVLDLCNLPVEEYMKPMEVIVSGGGDDSGGTKPVNVSMTVSVVSPNGDVYDSNGEIVGHLDNPTNTWAVIVNRDKNFNGSVNITITPTDSNGDTYPTTITIEGNSSSKDTVAEISGLSNDSEIQSIDYNNGTAKIDVKDDEGKVVAKITMTFPSKEDESKLYYLFDRHNKEVDINLLVPFTEDEVGAEGLEITLQAIPSQVYLDEYDKYTDGLEPYDDDDTSADLFNAWELSYYVASGYQLSVFIPKDFTDTVSVWDSISEMSANTKTSYTINNIEYNQYVYFTKEGSTGLDMYRYKEEEDTAEYTNIVKIIGK